MIATVLIAESATNSLRQFSYSNSSEGEKLKISDTSSDSPGTSFNIIYSYNEADKSLVRPARPLSPLQIISLSFIVEGKGLATLAAFLVHGS